MTHRASPPDVLVDAVARVLDAGHTITHARVREEQGAWYPDWRLTRGASAIELAAEIAGRMVDPAHRPECCAPGDVEQISAVAWGRTGSPLVFVTAARVYWGAPGAPGVLVEDGHAHICTTLLDRDTGAVRSASDFWRLPDSPDWTPRAA